MYLERPHLRFDGLYCSRNTYIRTGVTEWRVKNPVHLVCYYRYFRCVLHWLIAKLLSFRFAIAILSANVGHLYSKLHQFRLFLICDTALSLAEEMGKALILLYCLYGIGHAIGFDWLSYVQIPA